MIRMHEYCAGCFHNASYILKGLTAKKKIMKAIIALIAS